MTDTLKLDLVREAIPDIDRTAASGREAIKWEELLKDVREAPDNDDGTRPSFKAWVYDANTVENTEAAEDLSVEETAQKKNKTAAASRVAQVNRRLRAAVESQKWYIVSRPIKGTLGYAVYARYDGEYTKAELDAMKKEREEKAAEREAKKDDAAVAAKLAEAGNTSSDAAKLSNAAKKSAK